MLHGVTRVSDRSRDGGKQSSCVAGGDVYSPRSRSSVDSGDTATRTAPRSGKGVSSSCVAGDRCRPLGQDICGGGLIDAGDVVGSFAHSRDRLHPTAAGKVARIEAREIRMGERLLDETGAVPRRERPPIGADPVGSDGEHI